MASKITQHDLAPRTIRFRQQGLSHREIAEKLSEQTGEEISYKAVQRFLAGVEVEAAAVAHRPEYAEANAEQSLDIGERVRSTLIKLDGLIRSAEEGEEGPNWYGLASMLRESREHTRLYVELLERVHNAERIAAYQRALRRVLERESPELGRRLDEEFMRELGRMGALQ